jgi:hypothetical protein
LSPLTFATWVFATCSFDWALTACAREAAEICVVAAAPICVVA